MRRSIPFMMAGACLYFLSGGEVAGRGFGGGGGGFHASAGGYRGGEVSGYRGGEAGGFSSERGSYSSERSYGGYSGYRGEAAGSTYDRSYTNDRGGSVNVEGSRGAAVGPNGAVAGGTRDVTATTAGGRTYTDDRSGAVAAGPYGRTVGGVSAERSVSGAAGWKSAYSGTRFATDAGLSHYSAAGAVGVGVSHSTAYWSHSDVVARGGYVRSGFGYYNCFRPAWYTAHPGCWFATGWAVGAAWAPATWAAVDSYCGFGAEPYNYDFGNTIVYQDNAVYVGGQDAGTPEQYAQQAATIADKGIAANAPPEQDWKPLGVFALVAGDDKSSNNVFQLAVNKDGIIRGNYYDGLMDTTTDVYGSVDKKTQRAAWTIGKKKDRVFDAGMYNLTLSEAPVLVHFGGDKTQQMLLVRVDPPKDTK